MTSDPDRASARGATGWVSALLLLTLGCGEDPVTYRLDETPQYPARSYATVRWQGSVEPTVERVIDGGFERYMFRWFTDTDAPKRREDLGRHERWILKKLELLFDRPETRPALAGQIRRENPDLGRALDENGSVEVELTGAAGLAYFLLIEQAAETYRYGPVRVENGRGQSIEILYVMLERGLDFDYFTSAEEAYGFWVDMISVATSERSGLVAVNMRRILYAPKKKLERNEITAQQAIDRVVVHLMTTLDHELDHIFSSRSFSDETDQRLVADLRRLGADDIDATLRAAVLGEVRAYAYAATREPWGRESLGHIFTAAFGDLPRQPLKLRLARQVIARRMLELLGAPDDLGELDEVEAWLATRDPARLQEALETLLTDPRDGYGFYEAVPDYGFDTRPPEEVLHDAMELLEIDPASVEIRFAARE